VLCIDNSGTLLYLCRNRFGPIPVGCMNPHIHPPHTHTLIHKHTYIHTYARIHTHTHIYIYIYIYIYIRARTRTHAHTHTHTQYVSYLVVTSNKQWMCFSIQNEYEQLYLYERKLLTMNLAIGNMHW